MFYPGGMGTEAERSWNVGPGFKERESDLIAWCFKESADLFLFSALQARDSCANIYSTNLILLRNGVANNLNPGLVHVRSLHLTIMLEVSSCSISDDFPIPVSQSVPCSICKSYASNPNACLSRVHMSVAEVHIFHFLMPTNKPARQCRADRN